jgi:hypothetical protein
MIETCSECGSTELEPGSLMGAAVQVDRATTLGKIFAGAEVKVRVCLGCGRIDHFRADLERLRKGLDE